MSEAIEQSAVFWKSSYSSSSCVEVAITPDGQHVYVRNSRTPFEAVLSFTRDEWRTFLLGVKDDEFNV